MMCTAANNSQSVFIRLNSNINSNNKQWFAFSWRWSCLSLYTYDWSVRTVWNKEKRFVIAALHCTHYNVLSI